MSDDIDIKEPDWKDIPDNCPYCGEGLENDLSSGRWSGLKIAYRDRSLTHGECSELYCLSCDSPLQRHYTEADVTVADDPLVEPEPWAYRAHELEDDTVLKHREAQVRALKELDKSHSEISDYLGIAESTVGEYSRRISRRIEESIRTLEEMGTGVAPLRHIEAQFDGWVVSSARRWVCPGCNAELAPGDDGTVVCEFLGNRWDAIELFCPDCDPDVNGIDLDEAPNLETSYAIVEGTLDAQGDDYVDVAGSRDSPKSLTLRNPSVRKIVN